MSQYLLFKTLQVLDKENRSTLHYFQAKKVACLKSYVIHVRNWNCINSLKIIFCMNYMLKNKKPIQLHILGRRHHFMRILD